MMQQTVTSFSELSAGIDQVAFWHITGPANTPFVNVTAQLENYLAFASQAAFVPALAWTAYPVLEPLLASFLIEIDAKGMNIAAFQSPDCSPEFRPVFSTDVPTNLYFSQGVLSGREIYISLLTAPGATLSAQTTGVLTYISNILSSEGQDLSSLIEVNIYLASASSTDKDTMDAAYVSFFGSPAGGMPLRTVFQNATFVVPGQVGALVGMRALALKKYKTCDNSVLLYNVPDVYHEDSSLSSVAAVIPDLNQVYFAGIYGTRFPGNSTEEADPAVVYYNALQNILLVTSRQGAKLADLIYLETWYTNPLVDYNALASAIARLYNLTSFFPPAVTFDAGGLNPDSHAYQLSGLLRIEDGGYEAFPSAYPWAINGAYLREAFISRFGFDPGPLTNNTFCTDSTLPGCAKPGYLYNNYPYQPTQSLGNQKLRRVARTYTREEEYIRQWMKRTYPDGKFVEN